MHTWPGETVRHSIIGPTYVGRLEGTHNGVFTRILCRTNAIVSYEKEKIVSLLRADGQGPILNAKSLGTCGGPPVDKIKLN
jgi:hypothetical protein